jgi:alpha-L-fucosidase
MRKVYNVSYRFMIRGSQGFFLLTVFAMTVVVHAETTAQHEGRLSWWREARFGMFIHWGPVSLTGQEISWSRANSNTNCPNNGPIPVAVYDNLYKRFNPSNFNAGEWVDIAKSAGMKYMVLTAKHGDGFLLWNSKVDNYNISQTPFHRDVCAELARAADEKNEKIGWYFSPMDWRDPDCRSTNNDRFVAKIQSELRELLTQYGKICLVWFDLDGRPAMWNPATTYHMVRELQPGILINNRLEMGSFDEWGHQGRLRLNEDYYTPEQTIGAYDDRTPWETCMTIGTQWSWKPDDKIKSAREVVHILAQCAGGDGNLLLDVGPMPDGRIEPRQVDVLKLVGKWMEKNSESVYGTRGGPWKPFRDVASTRRGSAIYVHILSGADDEIELPDIGRPIKSAALLSGSEVTTRTHDGQLTLTLPAGLRDAMDTVVKLELDGSAMDLPAVETRLEIEASASNVFEHQNSNYGPQLAFDDKSDTRWATDDGTRQAWISAKLKQPQTIRAVNIDEAYSGRVQKFEFQYRDGEGWKTIFTGTTLGEHYQKMFEPVTAREFRLNILDAKDGPTISEIELLKR